MLKVVKGFAAAVAVSACLASFPAAAGFDGTWTVSIVTTRGVCEAGMALPIQISAGRVVSAHSDVSVTGHVAESGGITVRVIQGIKRAFGSGKLAETSGSGTWRGGPCSGTWTAQRI